MHQNAGQHVLNDEIFVVAISEHRDPCQRLLLRVGDGNIAFLRQRMLFLDNTEG